MLTIETASVLPIPAKQCSSRISADVDRKQKFRSDGSYDQSEYMSGGSDSVMSVPSQELGQSYNSHGGPHHSNLFPPSPAHYFLHAQYHPQFNPSKPLHHPEFHQNNLLSPGHTAAQSGQPTSHQQPAPLVAPATNSALPQTLQHLTQQQQHPAEPPQLKQVPQQIPQKIPQQQIPKQDPQHLQRVDSDSPKSSNGHLQSPAEYDINNKTNGQQLPSPKIEADDEKHYNGEGHPNGEVNREDQPEANGRSVVSPPLSKQDVDLAEKQPPLIKAQYLNSSDISNQDPQRRTPNLEEREQQEIERIKNDRTPSPNHRGTGFSPDENEARRRIESFIADQKDQGQTRADTFSPEENRSRQDSFFNERNRFHSPNTEENNHHDSHGQDHEGSETGSNYRYGDRLSDQRHHMRHSMSSDEGSNSQFNQHRDSYSGCSSSLSPVSSNGHHGSRSDSAPPTPNNHYFSPGGPFPGFPHSSTPTHSPHKLPPGVSPDNKDLFFCHLCSYVGTSKYHFNAHMNSHFEHRCPHCDYTSRTEGRLKRHMKDFHSDNPPENFSGMKMMRQVSRPKVFKCKQCDYQTEVKVDFWEHSRSHIKEEKVLQCPKCPFVTEYKHHLEYHLRNHFGSKPFKCNKCNYACVNKSMLNSHMKSHTNVYQYRCADCTYATKYCHSLKLHLKKYNHKPATVLNADGSLPTDGSGDFELVSKRGPPRGPRSAKRDKSPPGQSVILPHRTVPGPPPPPPPMNGGLMSPFWPMMAAAGLSNGLRPPPPLIPLPGMDPMAMGLPADPTKMPMGLFPPGLMPGAKSKCSICDFTADNPMLLTQHMFQVHATENQDLFNMYGIPADSIMEQAMRSAAEAANKVVGMGNKSFPAPSPSPKSRSSKSPGTPQPMGTPNWMKRESPDEMTSIAPTPPTTSTPRPRVNGEIPLDLTKPKSDFPFGPMSSMDFARVLKRPHSDVDGSEHNEDDSPPSADKLDDNAECSPTPRKRSRKGKAYKLDTICMKLQEKYGPDSPGGEEEDGYMSDMNSEQGESNHESHESPEAAMQRQISEDPLSNGPMSDSHMSEEHSGQDHSGPGSAGSMSNDHVNHHHNNGDSDRVNDHADRVNDHVNDHGNDHVSPPGIDYKEIHDSLRALNNVFGEDKRRDSEFSGDGKDEELLIHSENPEGDVAQALAIAQSRRRESSGSQYASTGINRRKMFMMRHEQQAAEATSRPMSSPVAAVLPASREIPRDTSHVSPPSLPRVIAPTIHDEAIDEPPKGSVYECTRCAIMFRDCIMYTMHMGYHGYQDPFKCNMCGHQAKDRVEFFLHIARSAHE